MSWVKSESGFRDFLSLVIVHAPDEFPEEDFLEPEEQLTLDLAFDELRKGIELLSARRVSPNQKQQLHELLKQAYSNYLNGEDVKAAHLLQELEVLAFAGV
jgi:recombinational DNA repair protein (RecF pathway)